EICRQLWGKNPAFTISSLGFISNMVLFVYGNLAKKLITTFCGDAYPFPGPNRIYQEAYRDGKIEIENWTVLTMPQRFLAGALGVEWMPTHSILGSTMEQENKDNLWIAEGPDGSKTTMVRALRPDLTLIHAWAADPYGNVLLLPPYAENVHAIFAAREGAIVTVEKIVDTDFLKKYSHFVKIPGYLVKAVCPAAMGVHPSGASNQGIKEFDAYAEDEEFMLELREACKDDATLAAWTEKWLLSCPDHDSYIKKIGFEKIWFLKGRSAGDSWASELATRISQINSVPVANKTEVMVTAAARFLKKKIAAKSYRTILAGIGASNLAAWKAWFDLRRDDYSADLMAEVGFFGYTPRPADPFIFNFRNIPACTMLTDILTVLGSMVGAESNRCIGVLGAGQIDQYGNVNSTKIPEFNLFLVGSGGACDVARGAQEVVVTIPLSKMRCVDKLSYITAPGERVKAVVTDFGIFEKLGDERTFTLTAYFPQEGKDEAAIIEAIRSRCGWELKVAPTLEVVAPPTEDELKDIRIFDPRRYFLEG
ncbi:MAG: hypothetical protein PHY31_03615, partial [Smithellaceae bacterium]|nr:hypothetical protein [Smithellaceae bacterium]